MVSELNYNDIINKMSLREMIHSTKENFDNLDDLADESKLAPKEREELLNLMNTTNVTKEQYNRIKQILDQLFDVYPGYQNYKDTVKYKMVQDKVRKTSKLHISQNDFYGIMGRKKGKGKMKPFDYENGKFVTNIIHQTMWPDKKYVQKLVDSMNEKNIDFEFIVKKRS